MSTASEQEGGENPCPQKFVVRPIGFVRWEEGAQADELRAEQRRERTARLEVLPEYEGGLRDIEAFSHLQVFCWLHRSSGFSLLVTPPIDTVEHGVFATCSPARPNSIGYWVVELVERRGRVLMVRGIDAFEGTPVIDLKPYFPSLARPEATEGWAEGKG